VAKKNRDQKSVQFIAMIASKRESKKGYKFLEVEDATGELTVMVGNDNTKMQLLYNQLLLDEVVGISGRFSNDMFIANDIFQPDLPLDYRANTSEEPAHVAFLSDVHVGSYLFLEKEFNRFIDCLNLEGTNPELFSKVKYVLIAGDLVDGIGIYPNQEKELSIPDIYKQYDFLASLLERIPEYIEVVVAMGNHDAVRGAEPQPRLDPDIGAPLYRLPNVHVVGNPVSLSLHGVRTLMYHGTSLDTIIGSVAGCSYSKPETAMIEYLKRRYLVPVYGNDSISPEREDYLTIKEIPDIMHCGHVHTNGYAIYRGVRVINSGTWQARTKYQEQLGHLPTPARVPIMNLQNHEVSVVHFKDE
jgi:DNA polymerase II small subunit